MLTEEEKNEILEIAGHYDRKRAASIEGLLALQKRRGWISDESLQDLAAILEMSTAELDSVATFYNLIYREPVGKHVILLCDSISCWICGCGSIAAHFRRRLNLNFGETTPDGRFTLLPIACLGNCDHAPAMMIDDDTYGNLTPDKLDEILESYR